MRLINFVCFLCLIASCLFLPGCNIGNSEVRMINSPYFGGPIHCMDLSDFGGEYYGNRSTQKIGMAYTCKGGFIDLGHLCESVNRTQYVYDICLRNLRTDRKEFSFRIIEPAEYIVKVKCPLEWNRLSALEKDRIIQEVSIELGRYISQKSTVWHEMITWRGYSSVGLFPEKPSSFSWEDLYSDFLGANIAAQALREKMDFNSSVTRLIKQNLITLGVQDKETARRAISAVQGVWYSGGPYPFIDMKKRHFDIGLSGYISPWLVPGICSNAQPQTQNASNINSISKYGLSFEVEIQPRESQKEHIFRITGTSLRISPEKHYPLIMEQIKREAVQESGRAVGNP